MSKIKLLALSGSTRKDSFNQRLLAAAATAAEAAGATVTQINLAEFPMPLMNQDLEDEHGEPEHAARLKALFVEHDGLLIASPEYNGSITPLLKNTLDWLSRKAGDEPSMVAYRNKTAAICSASPGRLGGLRGLVHTRAILGNLGVLVIPEQLAVGSAMSAFDDDGQLANDFQAGQMRKMIDRLVATTAKLK